MSLFNSPAPRRKTFLSLLLIPFGFAAWGSAQAATSYVRTDGGDATQCTGRADAAYSGSGTGQACAWKHPYFALSPSGTKRIAGGDTLIIGSGSYMMGAGAPGAGSCNASSCYMPPIPSGTSTTRTRIIGKPGAPAPKLWGTGGVSRVLNLQGSSNVEINNLEVTDQSDCVIGHSNSTAACSGGAYARTGLYAADSNNVQLTDVNIHGLGHTGIQAGRLANWTLDRVKINANGKAGWDGNVGTDSSSSGAMVLRNVEIAWNGCGERWQTGTPWACWAQQTGGYGDGLGMYWTAGKWLIEDSFVHHNTQDGVDLIYLDGADSTDVTVRRSYFKSNAGNQLKVRGNATIENSVIVSDCAYFEGKYYMLAEDNCRANGNTLVLVMTSNDQVTVRHNTISGEGGNLVGTTQGDSTGRVRIENNVLVGFTAYPYSDGRLTSLFYANNAPAPVTFAGNLVWNVKGAACPTGSICGQNPMLTNMTLDAFDAEPLAGSPAIDKVAVLTGMNNDFLRQARPSGVRNDIGAYEMQVGGSTAPTPPPTDSTCSRSAPTVSLSGPSTTVAAGTGVTYSMAVRNNDTSACSNTTFNLARTIPSGWTGTLSSSSLALAPGASGNASLTVTSATTATAGSYGIGVGVGSNAGSVHTQGASATYDVGSTSGSIGLTGSVGTSKTSYAAGETVYMSARVLNNGVAVNGASVRFSALKPNGVNTIVLKATTDSNGYARASFASGTGPSSIGTYRLTADATSGSSTATATSTFSVGGTSATEPVASGFTGTVGTSKTSYAAGETVYMSARVLNNGVAVSGASVRFSALKPNGVNTIVLKATTDSNGYARASFVSGTGSSSIGTYRLTADATSGSSTATATSTFSVGGTSSSEPVVSGFTQAVTTSKSVYAAGEVVWMTSRVLNNGVAVPGASVRFSALKPNGVNTVVRKATTDSNGYARASFESGTGSSSIGTYRLTTQATSGSSTATTSTTFAVN